MFLHITELLNCKTFDHNRISDIWNQYKVALAKELNISDKLLFDRWSDFCSDLIGDDWKFNDKTVGQFLNMFYIFSLEADIDLLEGQIDTKAKDFDFVNSVSLDEWDDSIKEERQKQWRLRLNINLNKEPIMSDIDIDSGHLMTLEQFVSNVEDGGFIDSDGFGSYATENQESNISIMPSHIKSGEYRKDFTHVIWYNK